MRLPRRRIETREARGGIAGMGYVGLQLALLFSKERFAITGFEIDPQKVETQNRLAGKNLAAEGSTTEAMMNRIAEARRKAPRAGSANSDKGLSGGSVRPQPKMAGMRRADEQTSASEPHSDFQGEGGFGRHQGRKDTFGVGAGV